MTSGAEVWLCCFAEAAGGLVNWPSDESVFSAEAARERPAHPFEAEDDDSVMQTDFRMPWMSFPGEVSTLEACGPRKVFNSLVIANLQSGRDFSRFQPEPQGADRQSPPSNSYDTTKWGSCQ